MNGDEYLGTEAWRKGEEKAAQELAKLPYDDKAMAVSLSRRDEPEYFKLCLICGWNRNGKRCHCVEEGLVYGNERGTTGSDEDSRIDERELRRYKGQT